MTLRYYQNGKQTRRQENGTVEEYQNIQEVCWKGSAREPVQGIHMYVVITFTGYRKPARAPIASAAVGYNSRLNKKKQMVQGNKTDIVV